LVLGEGDRDQAFINALCCDRQINDLAVGFVGGNSNFGQYLEGISALPKFSQCKSILLVSDNDESAQEAFDTIREQLQEIDFPLPSKPLEMAKKRDYPSLAVMMLPYPTPNPDSRGALETMLIPAMKDSHPTQAACLETMLACAGVSNWSKKSSQDKAFVRCLISSVWENDPMHGLAFCFAPQKNLIPVSHTCFDEVAQILKSFVAWSDSAEKSWSSWHDKNEKIET